MTRRERLPATVKGCDRCRSMLVSARHARSEAMRTRGLLARHANGILAEHYRTQALAAKANAADGDARYLAHHAEAHPLPSVVLPPTDNDRAPSHRKPQLPRGADLAARLRDGETLDALAAEYDRTPAVVARKISLAGFEGTTGESRRKRHDSDGLPILGRPWSDSAWTDEALCAQVDGDLFFPEKGGPNGEAKAICNGNPARGIAPCPVRAACLEDALLTDDRWGIRGGLTERERRKLKKAAS